MNRFTDNSVVCRSSYDQPPVFKWPKEHSAHSAADPGTGSSAGEPGKPRFSASPGLEIVAGVICI
jgi:hypothetical protein